MEELTKEEWQKILSDSNRGYKSALMAAAMHKGAADSARDHLKFLKFLDDGKNKKLPNTPE